MIFTKHSIGNNAHAFLSPSKYHWLNYDDVKLIETYNRRLAAARGTRIHNFAQECIELKQKLPIRSLTLNMFVNDAIGFRMDSEVLLMYSVNAFGTADAISFRDNLLRIHDLKTGVSPASMKQTGIYAAFFCLEYKYKPEDIDIELRLYQNDGIEVWVPESTDIREMMGRVVHFDRLINSISDA